MSTLEQSVAKLKKFLNLENRATHTNTNTVRLHHDIPQPLLKCFWLVLHILRCFLVED